MDTANVTLLTAFVAGIGSFLSPCVLPMMPTYAALLAGSDPYKTGHTAFLINSLAFLTGFTFIFMAMGATASLFGQFFFDYQSVIRKAGAVFMFIMGLQLAGFLKIGALEREYRPLYKFTFQGPVGAFLLGIAFTAGWTPCTGPILASILIYAGTTATMMQGAFLLFVYAMGFSVPFLVIALVCNRYLTQIKGLYKWLPAIHKMAGYVLMLVGVVVYFDLMSKGLGYIWGLF
ncbi:MAG: cytochrome c biogenesis protein CcdA [Negativicutes bacterium]|nr:cytochrome c biogenesis protein CcdA [Negativicutes bacterium]